MDMGLYRCLPYLIRTGMGRGKHAAQLEKERPVVVGARVWMAVSLQKVFVTDSTDQQDADGVGALIPVSVRAR
jgi:hypothetical protein